MVDHTQAMMELHRVSGNPQASTEPVAYAASVLPGQSPSLVDMLHRIDELDVIPQLQVAQGVGAPCGGAEVGVEVVSSSAHQQGYLPSQSHRDTHVQATSAGSSVVPVTLPGLHPPSMLASTLQQTQPQPLSHPTTRSPVNQPDTHADMQANTQQDSDQGDKPFPRVGRPRIRPPRERHEWHYHLGGVRHCRVPLNADLREVLEVAYVSRIMSKNFRKEGQPEKERIAKITGMDIDKVQEWFKNRRKKDRLLQDRAMGRNLPKCHRSRKSTTSDTSSTEQQSRETTGMVDGREGTGTVGGRESTGTVGGREGTGVVGARETTGVVGGRETMGVVGARESTGVVGGRESVVGGVGGGSNMGMQAVGSPVPSLQECSHVGSTDLPVSCTVTTLNTYMMSS